MQNASRDAVIIKAFEMQTRDEYDAESAHRPGPMTRGGAPALERGALSRAFAVK